MQQRQLRLGDILDDYCPRERRLTNHAVVAMVGDAVKQTRCTTCDTEHEYKKAKVPRQRRKNDAPAALYAQVAAGAPKRVAHELPNGGHEEPIEESVAEESIDDDVIGDETVEEAPLAKMTASAAGDPDDLAAAPGGRGDDSESAESPEGDDVAESDASRDDEGPFHRRLIRASLPRPEGQQPPARPIPEFTIRQPTGRQNRFRPRPGRGAGQGQQGHQGHQFGGNRSNGNAGGMRGGRPNGGRPGGGGMTNRRGPGGGGGRKRSK